MMIPRSTFALGYDFRASLDPATAKRRLDHFSARLTAAEITDDENELAGRPPFDWQSGSKVASAYRRLVEAQVGFARAQLDAQLEAMSEAARTASYGDAVSSAFAACAVNPRGDSDTAEKAGRPWISRVFSRKGA